MDTINHVDAELLKDVRIDMHHAETITDYSREEEDEAPRTHDALMRELEICRICVEQPTVAVRDKTLLIVPPT